MADKETAGFGKDVVVNDHLGNLIALRPKIANIAVDSGESVAFLKLPKTFIVHSVTVWASGTIANAMTIKVGFEGDGVTNDDDYFLGAADIDAGGRRTSTSRPYTVGNDKGVSLTADIGGANLTSAGVLDFLIYGEYLVEGETFPQSVQA